MVAKTVSWTLDKDMVWRKVRDRKPVVLDMNCWIDMADDKFLLATRIKDTLCKLVSDGLLFCPLSFGLICELYRQAEDSQLRVGTLMEELSLNVSYASQKEIFAWEVERGVRRLADAGPIDLSSMAFMLPFSRTSLRKFTWSSRRNSHPNMSKISPPSSKSGASPLPSPNYWE
jgi:hypothetical protein